MTSLHLRRRSATALVVALLAASAAACGSGEPLTVGSTPAQPSPVVPVPIEQVLADPQGYEGRKVVVTGQLDAGAQGAFLGGAPATAVYPPSSKTTIFMQQSLGEIPETTHACLTALPGPGGTVNREGGAVVVRGVFRHDEERPFGPKPGWSAEIEVPVITCPAT